jgi:hypothetical protein
MHLWAVGAYLLDRWTAGSIFTIRALLGDGRFAGEGFGFLETTGEGILSVKSLKLCRMNSMIYLQTPRLYIYIW